MESIAATSGRVFFLLSFFLSFIRTRLQPFIDRLPVAAYALL